MSAGMLVYLLAAGLLLAAGAASLDALLRQHRRASRWAWIAALLATLGVTAWAILLGDAPSTNARVTSIPAAAEAGDLIAVPIGLLATLGALPQAAGAMLGVAMTAAARLIPVPVAELLPVAWLGASLLLLAALGGVHWRLARSRRGWPETVLHGRLVRISSATGPAVLGVLRPCIVVPRWLLARSAEEQRLALEHEEEHVQARDHLLLAAACLVVALLPWHPAAWWMWSRLRLAIELDCDARLLRRGVVPRIYGALLIDLASHCSRSTVGATALADEGSHLERRLLAMTPSPLRFLRLRAGALAGAGALALLAACEARIPTSAEVEAMDVAGVERSLAASPSSRKHDMATAEFYVDGLRSSAEAAHAIAADRIVSMSVEHGAGSSSPSSIRIVTRDAANAPAAAPGTREPASEPGTLHQWHVRAHNALFGQPKHRGDDSVHVRVHGTEPAPSASRSRTFDGLIYVDGVLSDNAMLARIGSGADIASVEVFKGEQAARMSSDPRARQGIIRVTTRKAGSR